MRARSSGRAISRPPGGISIGLPLDSDAFIECADCVVVMRMVMDSTADIGSVDSKGELRIILLL